MFTVFYVLCVFGLYLQFFAQFASTVAGGSSSRTFHQVSDITSSSVRSGTQIGMQPFISASKTNLKTDVDAQGFW